MTQHWRAVCCWTGTASTPGTTRTKKCSRIPGTRFIGWTCCPAPGRCGSRSTVPCIAESTRPQLVFETMLPTRFYLPREDVTVGLHPSELVTYCAYKGRAAYLSPDVDSPVATDLAWTYENPLHDADEVRGMIAFFTERIDLFVDGRAIDRPVTGW